jgi:hypothetical protein
MIANSNQKTNTRSSISEYLMGLLQYDSEYL